MDVAPPFEVRTRLGAGGGGEVWAGVDVLSGEPCAIKVLAADSSSAELDALLAEATTLSGLEGLGLPRVLAFGTLDDGRRYLVREMIDGRSIEGWLDRPDASARPLLVAMTTALEQLVVLHRAQIFHGDIKPANIIVDPDGHGRLVDLGLAVRARGGTALPRGLTPAYAAPELFDGAPISARTEVFAAGRSLARIVDDATGIDLDEQRKLRELVARATASEPSERFPSIDELRVALMNVLGRSDPMFREASAWPIVGIDHATNTLVDRARELDTGHVLVVHAAARAGKSTVLRRVAWTLGARGVPTALLDAQHLAAEGPEASRLAPTLANVARLGAFVVVLDDARALDTPGVRDAINGLLRRGSRLIVAAEKTTVGPVGDYESTSFELPSLPRSLTEELVRARVPSLAPAHVARLVERSGGRPGVVRQAVERIGARVIVTPADLDACFEDEGGAPDTRILRVEALERAVARGRFVEAERTLAQWTPERKRVAKGDTNVRLAIAESKIAIARGDAARAAEILDSVEAETPAAVKRAWFVARARAYLRLGDFPHAASTALRATEDSVAAEDRALAAEALAVAGVAAAYSDQDDSTRWLERGLALAKAAGDARTLGIVYGSFGIAEQRQGRSENARKHFEASIEHSETAADASTLTTTHLNLAVILQGEGELGEAALQLEAGADMARRAGMPLLFAQALLNLANLDLYLGRLGRASQAIASLEGMEASLTAPARAQYLGLVAEAREREGEHDEALEAYEACAHAYDELGRSLDAFEARVARVLLLAEDASVETNRAATELVSTLGSRTEEEYGEHRAMTLFAVAVVRRREDQVDEAMRVVNRAIDAAERAGRSEWRWRALSLRARLHESKGGSVAARRDREAALEVLERIATRLPTDLAEVFWSDARRSAVRTTTRSTHDTQLAPPSGRPRNAAARGNAGGISTHLAQSTHSWVLSQLTDDRLQRILEITKELARERELPALFGSIVDHAISLVSADRGLVLLAGDDGALYVHTARDKREDAEYLAFSRSVAERVLASGEPVVSTSARDDAMFRESASVHKMAIQSVVCVPIRGAPPALSAIGALYLETRARAGSRFSAELPMLTAFADQAAIAIEYARLIEENKRRADELEIANAELAAAQERLASTLDRRTEQLARTRRDLREARAQIAGHFGYGLLVGTSSAMRTLYALIDRVRDTDIPILILGESGTGKEVVARTIHQQSARAKRPFLGINCGAIPHNLLESELFGHMRGAFTGADRDRKGVFRQADDGTLLLDEIGELPLAMQTGLLRVLQEKVVRPLGAENEETVHARIIAATNRSLAEMVERGEFREDLYYRLNVVTVRVPALRERREDIAPLVDHFLGLFAARYSRPKKTMSKEALTRLMRHDFPGNVRELEHILLGAWLMGDEEEIADNDLDLASGRGRVIGTSGPTSSGPISVVPPSRGPVSEDESAFKREERERILRALRDANWNRLRAAEILGMPRRTLYRRLKEYGIQ